MLGHFDYAPTDRVDFSLKKNNANGLSLVLYFDGGFVQSEQPLPHDAATANAQLRASFITIGATDAPRDLVESTLIMATCLDGLFGNEGAPDARLHATCAAVRDLFSDNASLTQRLAQIEKRFRAQINTL